MSFDYSYFYELTYYMLTTPSPSGYTHHVTDKLKNYAQKLGLHYTKTNKGNLIIEFEGHDPNEDISSSSAY